jgi:hypothetical protein
MERATEGDVQDLQPAADPQKRLALFGCPACQGDLHRVALGVDRPQPARGRGTIVVWVDVAAPAEHQTIHLLEGSPEQRPEKLGRDQDRSSAGSGNNLSVGAWRANAAPLGSARLVVMPIRGEVTAPVKGPQKGSVAGCCGGECRLELALLSQLGALARPLAQVVQLGPADVRPVL